MFCVHDGEIEGVGKFPVHNLFASVSVRNFAVQYG